MEPQMAESFAPSQACYNPSIGWYFPANTGMMVTLDPEYHTFSPPQVHFNKLDGWFYPAPQPTNIMAPPANPVRSVTTSARAPTRSSNKRKYGPGAYNAALAEGRTSVSTEEVNYFASNASRRDGRGAMASDPIQHAFSRVETRPSIVRTCVCKHHGGVKRPRNKFILYRQALSSQLNKEFVNDSQKVSRRAAEMWANESPEVKEFWSKKGQEEQERHARENPGYKYSPVTSMRSKFGTPDCKCGAYAANMARYNERAGGKRGRTPAKHVVAESDGDDDDTYIPATRARKQAPAPTAVMVPPPNLDIAALGLPGNQAAEAAAIHAGLKRKHEQTVAAGKTATSEEPRKRRSTRATVGKVNYAEPNDDAAIFRRDFDFEAPCKTFTDYVERSPKDSRSSRPSSLESTASTLSSVSSEASEPPSPAGSKPGKPIEVGDDGDESGNETGEEIAVAHPDRSTKQKGRQDTSASVKSTASGKGKGKGKYEDSRYWYYDRVKRDEE